MGRNNQQHRRAKAKARRAASASASRSELPAWAVNERAAPRDPFGVGEPRAPRTPYEQAARFAGEVLGELRARRRDRAEARCRELSSLAATTDGRRAVTAVVVQLLVESVEAGWQRGWRPDEMHRLVAREAGAPAAAVVADTMASLVATYAAPTVSPRWRSALRQIGAQVWWSKDSTFLQARAAMEASDFFTVLWSAMLGIDAVDTLDPIPQLEPLPGQWTGRTPEGTADRPEVEERVLERVRALLAKAESTPFEAEAEAFTAGAQSLMARHSIDVAMLAARRDRHGPGDAPSADRIGIDRPYEAPKVLLLDAVARANRCRTVWSQSLGFVTVIGFEADRAAVDALFTSLLVQSTSAVGRAGRRIRADGQSRTRAFRSSFLTAFATRVGQRLEQVTDEETEAGVARQSTGRDLVRILTERSAEVDDAVTRIFPHLVERPLGGATDAEGWRAGTQAADDASLSGPQSLDRAESGA